MPVKTVNIGLGFCFSVVLVLVLAIQGQAEEHYIYRNAYGRLVISNQLPPSGSNVLRKLELPEPIDPHAQKAQEHGDTQISGHSEGSAKPSKNR